MRVHVLPRSVVRYTHGGMSPNVWRSNAANAVFASKRLASTQLTHDPAGSPGTFATTFVHVLPASRDSCTLPSSVPTHSTFASFGDSLIVKIVVCISADELSTVTP